MKERRLTFSLRLEDSALIPLAAATKYAMIGHSIVLRALAGTLRDAPVANGTKDGTHLSEHPGSEHSPVHPHACTGRMPCCCWRPGYVVVAILDGGRLHEVPDAIGRAPNHDIQRRWVQQASCWSRYCVLFCVLVLHLFLSLCPLRPC